MTTAELIRDLADPGLTTLDICHRHDCTPAELLERCESDEIRPHLDALARMADIRDAVISPDEERLARATLTHLAIPNQLPTRLSVRHDELRRKSATTLLRKPTKHAPKEPRALARAVDQPTVHAQPLPHTSPRDDTQSLTEREILPRRRRGSWHAEAVTEGVLISLPILDPHTPTTDLIQSLASRPERGGPIDNQAETSPAQAQGKSGRPKNDRLKDIITRAGSALSAPARAPTDYPDTASHPPGRTDHRSSDPRSPDPTARCSHASA